MWGHCIPSSPSCWGWMLLRSLQVWRLGVGSSLKREGWWVGGQHHWGYPRPGAYGRPPPPWFIRPMALNGKGARGRGRQSSLLDNFAEPKYREDQLGILEPNVTTPSPNCNISTPKSCKAFAVASRFTAVSSPIL